VKEQRLTLSISQAPAHNNNQHSFPVPPPFPPIFLHTCALSMPQKPRKVRETFNALGVTGGAPKFKQHVKSARKPTSWERKALKAAKINEPVQSETMPKIVKAQLRAPDFPTKKNAHTAEAEPKRPQRPVDSPSSSSSSSDDDSSDDSSSSDEQTNLLPMSKGVSAPFSSIPKKTKKERIVSITFEHFPVQEHDFQGISVCVEIRLRCNHISSATFFISNLFLRDYCPTFWGDMSIMLEILLTYASLRVTL
jgi:hypothetical protein